MTFVACWIVCVLFHALPLYCFGRTVHIILLLNIGIVFTFFSSFQESKSLEEKIQNSFFLLTSFKLWVMMSSETHNWFQKIPWNLSVYSYQSRHSYSCASNCISQQKYCCSYRQWMRSHSNMANAVCCATLEQTETVSCCWVDFICSYFIKRRKSWDIRGWLLFQWNTVLLCIRVLFMEASTLRNKFSRSFCALHFNYFDFAIPFAYWITCKRSASFIHYTIHTRLGQFCSERKESTTRIAN